MKYLKGFLVLTLVGLLSGCLPPPSRAQQAGREYFLQGNYPEAIQAFAYASTWNYVPSEYAVGYMYYYGLGVRPDPVKAWHWIGIAARANYPPAEVAFEILRDAQPMVPALTPHASMLPQHLPLPPLLKA